MMVLGEVPFSQMAERNDDASGEDKTAGQLPEQGMDRNKLNCALIQSLAKMEESSCSREEDEDDDDYDEDSSDGDNNRKTQTCLLCGKINEDSTKVDERSNGKKEPYLCISCSQRFELIQQVAMAGEGEADAKAGLDDEDGEDEDADMKPIVSLEEADEELLVSGCSPARLRPGRRAAGLGAGALECAECWERFSDAASLERHAMAHLGAADGDGDADRDRPFKCDVCLRGFHRKDKLKLHVMIHRGDKPLKCHVCGKAFMRRDHLNNHVKTHSKPRAAGKQAAGKQAAGKPARATAPQTASHGISAGTPAGTGDVDDTAERDKPERPFGCKVCHKMFSRKDNLAAHMRIHTGEKPFCCVLCGKGFAEKCALKRHMVVHTQEKLYPCGICGRSFARKGHLTEHIWLHDEVKPFLCNVCGKAFARDRKLKSHMMTHSGERPHKCDVCERAFARRDNLKSHLSLHYGVKPARAPRSLSADPEQHPAAGDPDASDHGDGMLGAVAEPGVVPGPAAPDPTVPLAIPHPQHMLGHSLMGTLELGMGSGPLAMAGVGVASSAVGVGIGMGLVPS